METPRRSGLTRGTLGVRSRSLGLAPGRCRSSCLSGSRLAVLLAMGLPFAVGAGETPLRLLGGIPFVDVFVNGQGPFPMVLDSGAAETILTPRLARGLGIDDRAALVAQRRAFVSLRVAGEEVRRLAVRVLDPPQAAVLRLNHGADYQGLLGYTFLSRFVVTVDDQGNRLALQPGSHPPRFRRANPLLDTRPGGPSLEDRSAFACRIPMNIRDGLVYVQGHLNGTGPFSMLLDTGSSQVVLRPDLIRRVGLEIMATDRDQGVTYAGRELRLRACGAPSVTVAAAAREP